MAEMPPAPPNVPSVSECRHFFNEYKSAVMFLFAKAVDKPEDRFSWTREVNRGLVALERDVFLSGYQKATQPPLQLQSGLTGIMSKEE